MRADDGDVGQRRRPAAAGGSRGGSRRAGVRRRAGGSGGSGGSGGRVHGAHVARVRVRLRRRVPAEFAHVEFRAALFVRVVQAHRVDLPLVRLERTALRERLPAALAPVRTHTCERNTAMRCSECRQAGVRAAGVRTEITQEM